MSSESDSEDEEEDELFSTIWVGNVLQNNSHRDRRETLSPARPKRACHCR